MERDESLGNGSLDFGERIHNSVVGRLWSVDPLKADYPGISPYSFAANRPIDGIDFEGLSWMPVIDAKGKVTGFKWTDAAPDPANNIFALAIHVQDHGTFDETSEFNMGTATITVYGENKEDIFTFDGTSMPARLDDYPTVAEGLHTAVLGYHKQTDPKKRFLALRINNDNDTPLVNGYNPATKKTTAFGINLHRTYSNKNRTGLNKKGENPISAGCILCDYNDWDRFIGIFDNTSERQFYRDTFQMVFNEVLGLPLTGGMLNPAAYYEKVGKGQYNLVESQLPNPTIGLGINRNNPPIYHTWWQDQLQEPVMLGPFHKYDFPKPPNTAEDGD